MNGIDVSQWQGYINFESVKDAGIELVYIKASEGTGFVDPFFYRNYANAKNAGLPVGFYHYLTAETVEEARAEAYHFVEVTEGLVNEARLVADIEQTEGLSRAEVNQIARSFLTGVEEYSNKSVAIYADDYTASEIFEPELVIYPLWIAQYDVEEPADNTPWTNWAGWQYTDLGRVAGIQGNVDRDIFLDAMLERTAGEIIKRGEPPEDSGRRSRYKIYRIRTNDTLYSIARLYGTTVEELVRINKMKYMNLVYPGQLLKIPRDS